MPHYYLVGPVTGHLKPLNSARSFCLMEKMALNDITGRYLIWAHISGSKGRNRGYMGVSQTFLCTCEKVTSYDQVVVLVFSKKRGMVYAHLACSSNTIISG